MDGERYYEVEGAVFREIGGRMEVYSDRLGAFKPYEGDDGRVRRLSHPMSLEEVKPYMGEQRQEQAPEGAQ